MEKNVPLQVAGNIELRVSSLRFYCWRGSTSHDELRSSRPGTKSLGPWSSMVVDAEKRVQALAQGEAAAALKQLKPLYDQYRASWANLMAGVRRVIGQLPANAQDNAVLRLQQEMPEMANEDDFRRLAEEHQLALAGASALGHGAARIVDEFAAILVPNLKINTLADVEKLLARAATVLQTSAQAFVELRKGQEQFGTQMAVRTVNEMTALHQSREPADVLAYLLDPTADVNERIQELTSAYADIMIHQVALLNGMMEGVRGLLKRLSPEEIEGDLRTKSVMRRWLAPFRSRWRTFVERHREFTEEERHLSAAVFGAEFARAYAAVIGEEQPPKLLPGKRS